MANGDILNGKSSNFLNFNIGHVLTIAVVAGGWVYNYATNSTRIDALEKAVGSIQSERALTRPLFDNLRVESSTEKARVDGHDRELTELRSNFTSIVSDVAAIKTQLAVIASSVGARLPPAK